MENRFLIKLNVTKKKIIDALSQIFAVVEKDLKLKTRFKLPVILGFITPFLGLFLPLVILGQIFTLNEAFGPWNSQNYAVYIFTAYQINLIVNIRNQFPGTFAAEKIWKTLHAIIIAPFKRINLLFGIFITYFVLNTFPLIVFFIIAYIILPISILTILSIIFVYFCLALSFSGIGLFLGALAISKPAIKPIIDLGITLAFIFSCISYPFEFFPEFFQNIANLNPLFYIIDFIRKLWLSDNIIFSLINYPIHVLIILGGAVITPLVGLKVFNIIFRKYGIVGY